MLYIFYQGGIKLCKLSSGMSLRSIRLDRQFCLFKENDGKHFNFITELDLGYLFIYVCVVIIILDRAVALGQDLSKIPFKDRSWLGYKTRSRE